MSSPGIDNQIASDNEPQSNESIFEDEVPDDESDSDFQANTKTALLQQTTHKNVDSIIGQSFKQFGQDRQPSVLNEKAKQIRALLPVIKKYGLLTAQFNALFEVIMSKKLQPGRFKELIQCLLPRNDISEEYIIRIIGSISRPDRNLNLTIQLLKWSISIYDVVTDKERLRKLYPVLFHYLSTATIRPYICHLLYFLTRREHVIPYRVRRLQELIENEKNNQELTGLLLVYQTYSLDIQVPHNVRLTNRLVFQNPSPEIKSDLINIRGLWRNHIDASTDIYKAEFHLPAKKKAKTRKAEIKKGLPDETALVLDVIDITRIANDVEDLEVPDQLNAVLENRKLQHILVYKHDDTTIDRLSYWITQKVMEMVRWGSMQDGGKSELQDMLGLLLKFTRFTKSQLPAIEQFLIRYLKSWNGKEFASEIFELITYTKPNDYNEFYQSILKPLYRLYTRSDVKWKATLILCYTDLLRNWALLDWKTHARLYKENESDIDTITTAFGELSFDIDYFDTIQKLVEHVDLICTVGLLAEEDHPLLQHAGLTFFELVSTVSLQDDIPDIIIPADAFVHRNFYSTTAMALSRLCGILYQYKLAFEINDGKTDDWMSKHTPEYLTHFNAYLTDVCNCLWRNMGLSKQHQEERDSNVFTLSDQHLAYFANLCASRNVETSNLLSITHSPALAAFSKRFMTLLEEEKGVEITHTEPVTAGSLKNLRENGGIDIGYLPYRAQYLEYLNKLGFEGIYDLLFGCMTSLIRMSNSE